MNQLPKVIADLIKAQNNSDSRAYANCFTESAIVFDEGKTHQGKTEIQHWISEANEKYKTVMEPIGFEEKGKAGILKGEISGTFPGSPLVLQYHFEFENGLIESLKITG